MLYKLIITDTGLSYDGHSEDFNIGIFETEAEAMKIAEYYLKNIAGFCEYSCTYRIVPKEADGMPVNDRIWTVQGWNVNDDLDETDIIESRCFVSAEQAIAELEALKKLHKRDEWIISSDIIGKKHFEEGFCRI